MIVLNCELGPHKTTQLTFEQELRIIIVTAESIIKPIVDTTVCEIEDEKRIRRDGQRLYSLCTLHAVNVLHITIPFFSIVRTLTNFRIDHDINCKYVLGYCLPFVYIHVPRGTLMSATWQGCKKHISLLIVLYIYFFSNLCDSHDGRMVVKQDSHFEF